MSNAAGPNDLLRKARKRAAELTKETTPTFLQHPLLTRHIESVAVAAWLDGYSEAVLTIIPVDDHVN